MPNKPIRLIRLNEVLAMTGLSRSGMYRSIEKQQFPKQVSLGDRAVAWVESEVQAWVVDRVASR
ncbi:TPA: helix-turn-helix transcriptional regulator [Vibrio parahaemolyticus]|uniref:helix-turn-helix transcriptional regulator n=1 Tax=Vibrio parahaemolyticus TaxID=670 RepID=UPI00186A6F41|nr:AlpA family transcriptional regulator [Vibrio parahaemolyticus]MBE3799899.1 AlpA family transcriptional regulator [Vibrio parahaemolyticus]MBE3828953.1 AlpA family transcriptional regulator [Vibrio parahaemolyticus]MBE3984330.1 AlpA family transcriptional regulator [Vibrio parahaemolyticus]MCC3790759.1 AlpA family transcriptional regulator [Vibrio parahaemolyticus]HCG7193013.1 AlpA family transcriptional regulator [Vibrio parahaemolyticus]